VFQRSLHYSVTSSPGTSSLGGGLIPALAADPSQPPPTLDRGEGAYEPPHCEE
jgi:hypothetical protein